jgi:anti-sigma factor RsiW
MQCPTSHDLQRLYDGELADADAVRAHVASCPDCAATMQSLAAMSQTVRDAALPTPSLAATDRWIRAMRATQERSVLRLASWLTAVAAAILIGLVVWPTSSEAKPAARLTINEWETAMLTRDDAESTPAPLATAKWMAADLSESGNGWH